MPVESVSQEEQVDALGNVSHRYQATFTVPGAGSAFTVSVEGGPDWEARLIAEIQAEAAKVSAVVGLTV